MITGDNPLTAVHVAKDVEIVDREVMILDLKEGTTTDGMSAFVSRLRNPLIIRTRMAKRRGDQVYSCQSCRTIRPGTVRRIRYLYHWRCTQAIRRTTFLESFGEIHLGIRSSFTISKSIHSRHSPRIRLRHFNGWRWYQ